jgi:hypothetical protein
LAIGADVVSPLPPSFFEQPTANVTAAMARINNLFIGIPPAMRKPGVRA